MSDFPEDYDDPFDYDYYGPNSSGFGGHGFDDMPNPDDDPDDFSHAEPFVPDKPERSLSQIHADDPDLYEQLNSCIFFFAGNRHKRLLRIKGESAGWEKHFEAIEEDINSGYLKLENAHIDLGDGTTVFRLCLLEFDSLNNRYELSIDNLQY